MKISSNFNRNSFLLQKTRFGDVRNYLKAKILKIIKNVLT